jgi:hypothetical protein
MCNCCFVNVVFLVNAKRCWHFMETVHRLTLDTRRSDDSFETGTVLVRYIHDP